MKIINFFFHQIIDNKNNLLIVIKPSHFEKTAFKVII